MHRQVDFLCLVNLLQGCHQGYSLLLLVHGILEDMHKAVHLFHQPFAFVASKKV